MMACSRPSIPSELILELLDTIRYDQSRTFHDQTRDLKSLTLVSKQWSQHSQAALFRNVQLSTHAQCLAFLDAVGDNPKLGELVRKLKIRVSDSPTDGAASITQRQFVEALNATPYLYELNISFSSPTFTRSAIDALRTIACRPVALRFDHFPPGSELIREGGTAVYQLAEVWIQSLKFVVLGGGQSPYCLIQAPPLPPAPSPFPSPAALGLELKEFQWLGFDRPSDELLEYFLGGSKESLKFLSLSSLPSPGYFSRMMESHGPNIRSLRVRDLFGVDWSSLKFCNGLREFATERGGTSLGFAEVVATVAGKGSLEHLEFGVHGSSTALTRSAAQEVVDALEKVELPSLRTVTQKVTSGSKRRTVTTQFDLRSGWDDAKMRKVETPAKPSLEVEYFLVDSDFFPRSPCSKDYRRMNMATGRYVNVTG